MRWIALVVLMLVMSAAGAASVPTHLMPKEEPINTAMRRISARFAVTNT